MKRLCVYLGSSPGFDPLYRAAAADLGRAMAARGIDLVYGGGSVGLMGVIADAVLAAGFLKQVHRDLLIVADDIDGLFDRLAAYRAPRIAKWITDAER